jgi:predicted RNA-binding Zn-ribbon protein involved in translation (DUF1610 family)
MENAAPEHDCPNCGNAMQLARITPKLGPHPALLTFQCTSCGEVLTEVDDDGNETSE